MPIKTVLVAGVDDPNNHYIRLCLDHFLKPTHVPGLSTKSLPRLDAAIIVATSIRHELQWEIRELYEGKPIFFANNGISSIREEFDNAVYGPGTLEKLRSPDVPLTAKVYFLLGRFFDRGEGLEYKVFKQKVEKVIKKDTGTNLSNILSTGRAKGVFEAGKKPGHHIFKGLTNKIYDDMLKYGLFLEKDTILVSKGTTEILTPAMEVPEILELATPEVLPEAVPVAQEPIPLPSIHSPQEHPALELLLEQSAKQDARIEELTRIVKIQQKMLEGMEERISQRFEATMHVHNGLFEMVPTLRGLDRDGLQKANQMIGFLLENFTPRKVITPATPRQLS